MSMTPSRRKIESTRLRHLAEEGRAIVYRCHACRNETTFLASDVVNIWGPDMQVYDPPRRCGRCKVEGRMSVRFIVVTQADRGTLLLRRPAGTRVVQLWKDEFY